MKNKTVKLLAMVLSMAMIPMVGGCGEKKDTSTVETTVDKVVETTVDKVVETTADEVVETTVTEVEDKVIPDGDIVFYDELGEQEYTVIGEYEPVDEEITLDKEIPVYSEEGINVGHTKVGITIKLEGKNVESVWCKFKNPVSGTDYEYLYVNRKDLTPAADLYTTDEFLEILREEIKKCDDAALALQEEYERENPDVITTPFVYTEEADSEEGLEYMGLYTGSLLKTEVEDDTMKWLPENIHRNYSVYYIKITRVDNDGYFEYDIYAIEK